MIPTWAERCEKFGNEIVTNAMIQQAMQEEIDELRELQALVKSFFEDSRSGRSFLTTFASS